MAQKQSDSDLGNSENCSCGSGIQFQDCCEPYLSNRKRADTAVALMRSRYAGYVLKNKRYLLETWHPETRPVNLEFDPDLKWLGLKIDRCNAGQAGDSEGTVEFTARYKIAGRGHRLHEVSQFVKTTGKWLYSHAIELSQTGQQND